MSWRFHKSISLGKGMRINLGKKSTGISFGGKGFHVGVNSKRGAYSSMGIPGTGLYNIDYAGTGGRSRSHSSSGGSSSGTGVSNGCVVIAFIILLLTFVPVLMAILTPVQQKFVWAVLGVVVVVIYLLMCFTPQNRAKRLIQKALKLYDKDDKECAIDILKEAEVLQPKEWKIKFLLGGYLQNAGQYKEAIGYLQEIVNFNGDYTQAKLLLANCYYQLEEYEKAIPILQGIPETYERFVKVIELLGSCFAKLKQYDVAIETFKRGPILKRNLDEDLMELHYNMGIVYADSGDKINGLKHLKRVYAANTGYNNVSKLVAELETAIGKKTEHELEEDGA
jgi:tetratricopeptide (TPR) repeat protein